LRTRATYQRRLLELQHGAQDLANEQVKDIRDKAIASAVALLGVPFLTTACLVPVGFPSTSDACGCRVVPI
jgi:hypothetical protein